MRERAATLMEQFGISHRANFPAGQISGGELQRVAIARAIVNKPPILLADEPTGSLDSKTAEEIMNLLKELNLAGTTIIMVTHSPYDANYAHRIINLFDGKVVTENIKEKFHV